MSEWKGTNLCSWEDFLERLDRLRRLRAESNATKVLNLLFRGDRRPQRNLETSLEREKLSVTLSKYFERVTTIRSEMESVTERRWDDVPKYPGYRKWMDSLGDASKGRTKPLRRPA